MLNQLVILDTKALLRSAVLAATAFLLVSMGGAIVGSPFLLPLLAWTARTSPSRRIALAATVLAALVGAEVGWAAAYVTIGERQPGILAVPILTGALVFVAFAGGCSGDPAVRARAGRGRHRPGRRRRLRSHPRRPGGPDPATFVALIGIAVVAAAAGSLVARPELRAGVLGLAALILIPVGFLALLSIRLPLLGARGLAEAECAKAARRRTKAG